MFGTFKAENRLSWWKIGIMVQHKSKLILANSEGKDNEVSEHKRNINTEASNLQWKYLNVNVFIGRHFP